MISFLNILCTVCTILNEQGILPEWPLVFAIYEFHRTNLHVKACEQISPYCIRVNVEPLISIYIHSYYVLYVKCDYHVLYLSNIMYFIVEWKTVLYV